MKSPILEACAYGQLETIEHLLKEGADPCVKSYCGRTALHEVCMGGHISCLERLLELQCDVDAQDSEGLTAAHIAAFNGEEECLRILATKGANLILGDKHGRLTIHLAAMRSHFQILHLLCNGYGISFYVRCNLGKTPLHYATQYGSLRCLKYLVQHGCEVNYLDNLGFWAAYYAARYNRLECLRYLMEQGTSVTCSQKDNKTLLHVAGFYGSVNVLHWLLERGFNPNTQDDLGNTVGHQAALKGKPECYSCFLNHGGNPKLINLTNDNPMGTAKRAGHVLLLQKAANKEILCPLCENALKKKEWITAHPNISKENKFLSYRNNQKMSLSSPLSKGQTYLELYTKCNLREKPMLLKCATNPNAELETNSLSKSMSCISFKSTASKNFVHPNNLFTFSI
ncbi:unnamed protein product [Acanthosepion pharaonis]|uniref:Uncharacterized protein n=1 Tax=Acanthosepion pharaonis TaxID=158019 RepID=A0A812DGL2_ACAPH|nr:unnamed protein product [Sepia pharaonis]